MSLPFDAPRAVPLVQTLHHSPSRDGDRALVALSGSAVRGDLARAGALLAGLNVVGTVHHGIDTDAFAFSRDARRLPAVSRPLHRRQGRAAGDRGRAPDRLAADPGRGGERLLPDGRGAARRRDQITYAGEAGIADKVALLGGARALLYPVQAGEPFGLVLAEAMACGTPVAALDRGAVREVVEDGITGGIFSSLDQMVAGLPAVIALDRASVRARTVARFGVEKMIDAYEEMYARLAPGRRSRHPLGSQRIDAALAPGTGS